MQTKRGFMLWSTLAAVSAGCGSVGQFKSAAEKPDTSPSSGSANLAADEATTTAETEAQSTDSGTDTTTETPQEPTFLSVVKAARDYTRTLLGLSDEPLKEFKAAVEAARTLATSRDDFKQMIAPAQEKLKSALETQKTQAEEARKTHADELQKIFEATTSVFKECAVDIELKPHHPGQRGGPVSVIGNGEFSGDFKEFRGKMGEGRQRGPHHPDQRRRGPRDEQGGQGPLNLDDSATDDSAECDTAVTALKALLPADG